MAEAPIQANPGARGWIRYLVVLGLTALVVWILIREFAGADQLGEVLRQADWQLVVIASVLSAAGILFSVVRWQITLSVMGYSIGYWRALNAILSTYPLAVVTPSRGNDFLRAFAVRDLIPVPLATSGTLVERVVDLLGLFMLGAIGAAVQGLWLWAGLMLLAACAELVVIALLLKSKGWLLSLPLLKKRSGKLEQLFDGFGAMLRSPVKLVQLCVVSLTIRLMVVGVGHCLFLAMGVPLTFLQTLATWPVAIVVGLMPLTLGGMGTRDAAFVYILRASYAVEISEAAVVAGTLGYSAIAFWAAAAVGVPFMIREGLIDRDKLPASR